jgi:hypothetical protein
VDTPLSVLIFMSNPENINVWKRRTLPNIKGKESQTITNSRGFLKMFHSFTKFPPRSDFNDCKNSVSLNESLSKKFERSLRLIWKTHVHERNKGYTRVERPTPIDVNLYCVTDEIHAKLFYNHGLVLDYLETFPKNEPFTVDTMNMVLNHLRKCDDVADRELSKNLTSTGTNKTPFGTLKI